MDWLLFIQIEIILFSVGLIIMFVASAIWTIKDNSFGRRAGVIGETLAKINKDLADQKAKENQKLFGEFLNTMVAKKEENSK